MMESGCMSHHSTTVVTAGKQYQEHCISGTAVAGTAAAGTAAVGTAAVAVVDVEGGVETYFCSLLYRSTTTELLIEHWIKNSITLFLYVYNSVLYICVCIVYRYIQEHAELIIIIMIIRK